MDRAESDPQAAVAAAIDAAPPGAIGVAVSGGGDSTALLLFASASCREQGRTLHAVTVDHRLRPESATEAQAVARLCASLDVDHETLVWSAGRGPGNLQDQARAARRRLIAGWAARHGLAAVLLGHTQDDQAETFLMRLARGSGVDGLAAMDMESRAEGVLWLRPLLGATREELRAFLRDRGVAWAEDPGNLDPASDRIRFRQALPALADLGLTPARLAQTAAHMRRARAALEAQTAALAREAAEVSAAGSVLLKAGPLAAAPVEIRHRLVAHALQWVSAAPYRPRYEALAPLAEDIATGPVPPGETLHGCLIRPAGGGALITREPARTGPPVPAGEIWDGRWRTSADAAGLTVAALGPEGLAQIDDWRASGLRREVLLATPAFRRGETLVAAPFAKPAKGCHSELKQGPESFFALDESR